MSDKNYRAASDAMEQCCRILKVHDLDAWLQRTRQANLAAPMVVNKDELPKALPALDRGIRVAELFQQVREVMRYDRA